MTTADTHVRLALPAEADQIGEVQVAAWRRSYDGLLPDEVLDQLDAAQFAESWRAALLSPGQARNRVLVALDHERIVAFAATTGSDDPDADPAADALIAEFCVHPDATDDTLRTFLTESGWEPDGAHRELDLYGDGTIRVKQVRLHTDPRGADQPA